MPSSSSCPEDRTLREFLAGDLADDARAELGQHLLECERCRQRFEDLTHEPVVNATSSAVSGTLVQDDDIEDVDWEAEALQYLQPSLTPGSLGRIGEYEVLEFLGAGAMGLVMKAYETRLSRMVAIKLLNPRLTASVKAQRRFLREARSAASIGHPNVVTIHAIGVEAGIPYLVMEYIAGISLRQRLHAEPKLEPLEIARIGGQIATGLAAAHQVGVVHRDIKLANIMLERESAQVKITDFGLARAAMDHTALTSIGHAVGTPAYMSPEQVKGEAVDDRSDLFSLGCVLYAMATGNSPFAGNTNVETIHKVSNHTPPPLRKVNPEFPAFLSDLVERLLQKRPRDRIQTAAEVAAYFAQFCAAANLKASIELPKLRPRRWTMASTALLAVCLAGLGWTGWELFRALNPQTSDNATSAELSSVADLAKPVGTNKVTIPAKTVTVSKSSPADFQTIVDALPQVGPGSTIRVLDDETYEGNLLLDDPDRWHDLTIEAPKRATIVGSPDKPDLAVIRVRNNAGVTLRGLKIDAKRRQFGLFAVGAVEGCVLEDLEFIKEPRSEEAAVAFMNGATGTRERPIVVRRCRIAGYSIGLYVQGSEAEPASWFRIEDCRFRGPDATQCVAVILDTAVHDVAVIGNVFATAFQGINVNLEHANLAENVEIAHNSFFGLHWWLGFGEHPAQSGRFSIHHNLIVDSTDLRPSPTDLRLTAAQWFHDNCWEMAIPGNVEVAHLVAEVKESLSLVSRDLDHPDFLRPASEAGLARPDPKLARPYIGALQPGAPTGGTPAVTRNGGPDHE